MILRGFILRSFKLFVDVLRVVLPVMLFLGKVILCLFIAVLIIALV